MTSSPTPPVASPNLGQDVVLMGMPIARYTETQLLEHMARALEQRRGGWIVTANLDILMHFVRDPVAQSAYMSADLRIADGMPLIWASKVQGQPLPERVAGSTLSVRLLALAASRHWPVCLLGGSPGSAERAAERYREQHPKLDVLGHSDVQCSAPPTNLELDELERRIRCNTAQIVLVGLGSPKQELVIRPLRERFPEAWFIGVGGTFSFLAGDVRRAPVLLQRSGLEWLYRLSQDPRRLGRRYARNLQFLLEVVRDAAAQRNRAR